MERLRPFEDELTSHAVSTWCVIYWVAQQASLRSFTNCVRLRSPHFLGRLGWHLALLAWPDGCETTSHGMPPAAPWSFLLITTCYLLYSIRVGKGQVSLQVSAYTSQGLVGQGPNSCGTARLSNAACIFRHSNQIIGLQGCPSRQDYSAKDHRPFFTGRWSHRSPLELAAPQKSHLAGTLAAHPELFAG